MSRFSTLVVLLVIISSALIAESGKDDHNHHHDLQHHRKHSRHPKHPHLIIVNTNNRSWSRELAQHWRAYQIYLKRALPLNVGTEELPWWFHLIPPWIFPWPPVSPPPPLSPPPAPLPPPANFTSADIDRINFALNIHYLQAEFFLHAAFGHGLDKLYNATLAKGGPSPIGGLKAKLSQRIEHVAKELGFQTTGHIRAIHRKLLNESISRPLLKISAGVWDSFLDKAVFQSQTSDVRSEFDPYENDANFLLAAYVIPYLGLNTLVDTSTRLTGIEARKLVSGLMGVQAGQDAVIRTLLFEIIKDNVVPFNVTVSKLTSLISNLRLRLDHTRKADEGLTVHLSRGAEKMINGNLISANDYSMAISRSPQQILQILYGSGNASRPGLFFPDGAKGHIAHCLLRKRNK